MIPGADITAWGQRRPWPSRDEVEQDLLLSRLIVEIYTDPYLRDELIFRGGTCLHQRHLPRPLRYSEDLDFVRTSADGIGQVFDQVLTFQPDELVATKLRALYQRKKGRDLFDLWLALAQMHLDPQTIVAAFEPYRPVGYTGTLAVANLRAKLEDLAFVSDLDLLLQQPPAEYDVQAAGRLVISELLSRV